MSVLGVPDTYTYSSLPNLGQNGQATVTVSVRDTHVPELLANE